jgi:hypothetical protein
MFWSLAIGLILLVLILFLIPALLGSRNPTISPSDQATITAISATNTAKQRFIGILEAALTQTAQVTPEPDQ